VLKVGESVETMIVNIDRKSRSIQLSIKARDTADTAETIQRMTEASASSGTTNLGALLKAKLDQQRDDG
jgi:small subunit ribosomal protein S1